MSQLPADTLPQTQWTLRGFAPPAEVAKLSRALGLPPLLAHILWARGVDIESLKPTLSLSAIPALQEAASRLALALEHGKRILIHGDYDADGISGTALLTLGLRALGGNVTPFIPNRLKEGYGIYPGKVDEHASNADLFVTVDCGISNLKEIAALQAHGVEVIITDHHHPGQALPACLTVHPSLSPMAQKGQPELTGAGVAYHLLWALHQQLGLEDPTAYSDLATLGTVADVAPLMGENRALVSAGLRQMQETRWPGIRAMVKRTLAHNTEITATDVAFVLAPRLNAAGRLGEADLGLELLTTASERRALELASYLDTRNADRRKVQDSMLEEALRLVDPAAPALVLEAPNWHPGVMGIVASKVLERFYKPVFIVAQGKGSVRSTPGISAVKGLEYAHDLLERYGGHSQAAGFSIAAENFGAFKERIEAYAALHPAPQPAIIADALLNPEDVTNDLYKAIKSLEPYGTGHPAPVFALHAPLEFLNAMGQGGKHLTFTVGGVRGVSWGNGEIAHTMRPPQMINAAVSLQENTWQNRTRLEFKADALRPAAPLSLDHAEHQEHLKHQAATRIYRQKPPAHNGEGSVRLQALPLELAKPLTLTAPIGAFIREQRAHTLHFDLGSPEKLQETLRHSWLPLLPDVAAVRNTFAHLRNGTEPDYPAPKLALCRQILRELGLLSERGGVVNGQKRDPYSSETLLQAVMERYKISSFVKAYGALDDAGFAAAVLSLFT